MEKIITVTFEPEGRRVRVPPQTSIFQAASEAGIGIRTECGGEGTCGKCRVIVKNKSAVNEVTDAETAHLSPREIDSGYRLACRTILKQNVTVMVPEESRIGARKIQITGLERPVPLNPSVKKFHVVLPKPTLSDVRPDFKRLLDHLENAHGLKKLEIDYELL
ncbi:MAG: 2Fe-2S iron-sulfur cluster binding domain-containing protein, partial [Candidatus Korarchaeota archaeon]|nr:2Fe-2S iron-sulfur cluster binding domain-containing protein [Candidatus Korarchaeota archaeon]